MSVSAFGRERGRLPCELRCARACDECGGRRSPGEAVERFVRVRAGLESVLWLQRPWFAQVEIRRDDLRSGRAPHELTSFGRSGPLDCWLSHGQERGSRTQTTHVCDLVLDHVLQDRPVGAAVDPACSCSRSALSASASVGRCGPHSTTFDSPICSSSPSYAT